MRWIISIYTCLPQFAQLYERENFGLPRCPSPWAMSILCARINIHFCLRVSCSPDGKVDIFLLIEAASSTCAWSADQPQINNKSYNYHHATFCLFGCCDFVFEHIFLLLRFFYCRSVLRSFHFSTEFCFLYHMRVEMFIVDVVTYLSSYAKPIFVVFSFLFLFIESAKLHRRT